MAAEENTSQSIATVAPEVTTAPAVTVADVTPSATVETPVVESALTEIAPEKTVEPVAEVKESPRIETLLSQKVEEKPTVSEVTKSAEKAEVQDSVTEKVIDKKDEASQSEKASLPTYELKLPDDIKIAEEGRLNFTKLLGEYETKALADPKSIHTAFQELGQELMNRHINEVKNLTTKLQTDYAKQSDETKANQLKSWKEEVEEDPIYGGNRLETTINAAEKAIKTYGGDAKEQQEFRDALMSTGLINNKAMIRMLANVTAARPSPVPLAAKAPAPQKVGMMQKRYGRVSN